MKTEVYIGNQVRRLRRSDDHYERISAIWVLGDYLETLAKCAEELAEKVYLDELSEETRAFAEAVRGPR